MEIGGIRAAGILPDGQMAKSKPVDSVSKKIQNEIMNVQRQLQKLSSDGELSAEEKMRKRQEFQKEISSLNAKLRQRQAEVGREQKRETFVEETQQEKPKKEKVNKDQAQTDKEPNGDTARKDVKASEDAAWMKYIAEADSFVERAEVQGAVISKIDGAVLVLKGEIRQDEDRGVDTEKKQQELKKREEQMKKASDFQGAILGESHQAVKEAAQANTEDADGRVRLKRNDDKVAGNIQATNFSKEDDRNEQQKFVLSSRNV